jgi:hypothetical protein
MAAAAERNSRSYDLVLETAIFIKFHKSQVISPGKHGLKRAQS